MSTILRGDQRRAEAVVEKYKRARGNFSRLRWRSPYDILPYRYQSGAVVDLGRRGGLTIAGFVALTGITKTELSTLSKDIKCLRRIISFANESNRGVPKWWADVLDSWSNTSPDLVVPFVQEILMSKHPKQESLGADQAHLEEANHQAYYYSKTVKEAEPDELHKNVHSTTKEVGPNELDINNFHSTVPGTEPDELDINNFHSSGMGIDSLLCLDVTYFHDSGYKSADLLVQY